MTDNSKKIAEKIAKCLALAQSENANEAESALRQAKALMQKYHLTAMDVAASKVNEHEFKTSTKNTPALYIAALAKVIASVFGCEVIAAKYLTDKTAMRFIGIGSKPELAGYTFDVLQRHIKRDRRLYLATLTRCGRDTKTRRGDLFCQAWVDKIKSQVSDFAKNDDTAAINAFMEKRYENLTTVMQKQPEFKAGDYSAWFAGQVAAKKVSIHQPVQAKAGLLVY